MPIDREKVRQNAEKFIEKRKYDKAVLEYQKIIQEDPNDARTLLKIGDLQSKMEAYADAVATYERVGNLYKSQGFALKAVAVFKQIKDIIAKHAPQLEEKYAHITPKLAELYQQLQLTSDALQALDEWATRLQRLGKDNEAIEVFRRVVELDATNPLTHLRLAEALSRVKNTEGAVQEFALAASQLVKNNRRDDALKVFERLLHHKNDPTYARLAAELYIARNHQNDVMQALAKLQLCFQANPKDLDTLQLLAQAFTLIGQSAKAFEVNKEMARIAREQGKHDLFRQVYEKLVQLAPNDPTVRALAAEASSAAQVPAPAQSAGARPPPQDPRRTQVGVAPPGGAQQPPRQPAYSQQPPPQQPSYAPQQPAPQAPMSIDRGRADLRAAQVAPTPPADWLESSARPDWRRATHTQEMLRGEQQQPPPQAPAQPTGRGTFTGQQQTSGQVAPQQTGRGTFTGPFGQVVAPPAQPPQGVVQQRAPDSGRSGQGVRGTRPNEPVPVLSQLEPPAEHAEDRPFAGTPFERAIARGAVEKSRPDVVRPDSNRRAVEAAQQARGRREDSTAAARVPPEGKSFPRPLPREDEPPSSTPEIEELSYDSIDSSEIESFYVDEAPSQRPAVRPYDPRVDAPSDPIVVVDDVRIDEPRHSEGIPIVNEPQLDEPAVSEQLGQFMADAEAWRQAGHFSNAVETLHAGLRIEPRSIELRSALRDLLLENGYEFEALQQMIDIASLYLDAFDGESAVRSLQDALVLDPQNEQALATLRDLGYDVPPPAEDEIPSLDDPIYAAGEAAAPPVYDSSGPLPSYDLEEIGPDQVADGYATLGKVPAARSRIDDIDDPFASEQVPRLEARGGEAPLPSFPLDAHESDTGHDIDAYRPAEEIPPELVAEEAVVVSTTARPSSTGPELEEALEEAEFFAARGIFDDARSILVEQLARLPNHPLLVERLNELNAHEKEAQEQAERAAQGSGARAVPRADDDDRAFDIATALDALEGIEGVTEAALHPVDEQIDVEEVFAKFKEGVEKQLSVDDVQSRYDLGVAYREMGLLEDAVREFEIAARDPKRECVCESMIGTIELDRGNIDPSLAAFLRALGAEQRTPEQETVLWFEVGSIYETKQMNREALSYYQRVQRRDPSYRDVEARIRRIQPNAEPRVELRAAVGADDEFDRAFDGLLAPSGEKRKAN